VAALAERLDSVRREMIDRERLAVVEERLNEFKRTIDEAGRRRWAVVPSIVGGVIGAVLAFLGQLVLTSLRK
jgi:hypothetical protein